MAAVLINRLYGSCFTKQAVWQLFWQAGCMTAVLVGGLYGNCFYGSCFAEQAV